MDLSGTNGRNRFCAAFAAWSAGKFKIMRGPLVQQRRNDQQETEEARFLVVKKIRDAILDETFKPGGRLPEEQVGKMFQCQPVTCPRSAACAGKRGHGR
jgi:hypothetical protein